MPLILEMEKCYGIQGSLAIIQKLKEINSKIIDIKTWKLIWEKRGEKWFSRKFIW